VALRFVVLVASDGVVMGVDEMAGLVLIFVDCEAFVTPPVLV